MAKDVNIHLKTTGSEKTKQDLDKTGQSAKRLGDKTAEGQKRAGAATEQGTKKLGRMGTTLSGLSTKVAGFIGAWLGLNAVIATVTELIQKLKQVEQIQKEIYRESLSYAEVGQALEIQTGTVGKQQFWTEQAIAMQKAGALPSAAVAGEMLIAMDVTFKTRGGILDPVIRDLGKELAPFIGAAEYSPKQAGQLFQIGAVAGVEPTAAAYLEFMGKQHAAYKTSASTDPGAFLSGFTRGGIPYIGMGGTLKSALARFSAAKAVTESEALAGSLLEQASRVAGGGREKSRLAMEESQGVSWPDLTMDQRVAAMLEHVKTIPENIRSQILLEQGFPEELSNKINLLVLDRAEDTYKETLNAVYNATPDFIQVQGEAYLESMLGKFRLQQATTSLRRAAIGPKFADWQTRLQDAQDKTVELQGVGDPRSVLHPAAPYLLALETMSSDLQTLYGTLEDEPDLKAARALADDISYSYQILKEDLFRAKLGLYGPMKGTQYEKRLQKLADKATPTESPTAPAESPIPTLQPTPTPPPESAVGGPVSVNYDHRVINQTIFNPFVGMNKQDLRIEPPYLNA